MAKFRLNEKARYVGPATHGIRPVDVGAEIEIISVGCAPPARDMLKSEKFHDLAQRMDPGKVIYGVLWADDSKGSVPEHYLEKLLPKHQPDDLRVAEPHFINHQLPRWLKQEETTNAE